MKFQLFGRLKDNEEGAERESSEYTSMGGEPATESMEAGSNLERTVEEMFNQGYSEEEIKQDLVGEYSERDIDDAINRAVASRAGGNQQGGPQPMSTYNGEGGAESPIDEGYDENREENNMREQPEKQPQRPVQEPQPNEQMRRNTNADPATEELVETIVSEKMGDVMKEFENAYAEIDEIHDKVDDIEDRVEELEIRDDEDQQQFVQKVDEMEDHVDEYQSRIGGLEKAFQQVLPSLVENVRDLTELVQEIKDEKGIETESTVPDQDMENIDVEDW